MMTRRDEANKLFPALDDSPDNMKIRLQHSLDQHDRGKQIRAINNGVAHPPFELGHNLAAADRVHSDLKAGVHVADAIDSHFPSGALIPGFTITAEVNSH